MLQLSIFLVAVLGFGLAAQWIAWRLRIPAILLLLLLGFVCGACFGDPGEQLGPELLLAIVSLSVAVILFEGGLSLRLAEVRETGRVVIALVTVGIAVTWLLTAVSAVWVLGFSWPMAALVAAILVVSGPTVVVPLLRQVHPNRRVGAIVKWEGIVNDPIGAILAVTILVAMISGPSTHAILGTLTSLVVFLATGAVVGALVAVLTIQLLKRYWIPDYLQNPALLTIVVASFLVSNLIRPESGLMAVTVMGIVLANQKQVAIRHVVRFKENLRVLLISCLFVVLAARMKPESILELGVAGGVFLGILILVVRPVAAFVSTIGSGLRLSERAFLAWIHPRGIVAAAVCSVFALELAHAAHPPAASEVDSEHVAAEEPAVIGTLTTGIQAEAEKLVPVTFLVIVGTVTVYGLTVAPLARWLKVAEVNPQGVLFAGANPLVQELAAVVQREGFPVLLVDLNQENIATARMRGLPVYWANICSEYAREELELAGIGRLLAMTPSDEVNSLAVREFIESFGRVEIYQLAHRPTDVPSLERLVTPLPGRILFNQDATFDELTRRLAAGATVKATNLTSEFDYNAFLRHYGASAVVLMVISSSNRLRIVTAESTLSPQPGEKLISLVEAKDAATTDRPPPAVEP